MYRRIEDFRSHWQEEVVDTLKVIDAIPDAKLGQAVSPEHRDLRRLAWHLASSVVGLPAQMGLKVEGPQETDVPAASAKELRDAYARAAQSLLDAIQGWTGADLEIEDTMYGHLVWKRGYSLQALEMHQAHHRGQMTVLLRQAGLKVPEFYGPTKESWAKLGMPEPVA
ncbi:MAG TPA: DinB family protein [Holophagaceae bacterium]|nr:DinB family protein [Holophagaceae bacterium]